MDDTPAATAQSQRGPKRKARLGLAVFALTAISMVLPVCAFRDWRPARHDDFTAHHITETWYEYTAIWRSTTPWIDPNRDDAEKTAEGRGWCSERMIPSGFAITYTLFEMSDMSTAGPASRVITTQQWREVLDQYAELKRRYASFEDLYPMTYPNPPATQEQLQAAEDRLGYRLDPSYRNLLSVANGWEEYQQSLTLFGTEDIMQGRWDTARECVRIFFQESSGVFARTLGIENDSTMCQPVIYDDNGYNGMMYMLPRQGRGSLPGNVFGLHSDSLIPSLYSYLVEDLTSTAEFIEQETLGPHSRTWGRDIRIDPPTMADIVAKHIELVAQLGGPPRPNADIRRGASTATLDQLDDYLGGALHPEHRELLAVADGLDLPSTSVGHVLSTDELQDPALWASYVDLAVESEQRAHEFIYRPGTETHGLQPSKPAIADRIGVLPVVPFAAYVRPDDGLHEPHCEVWGVDTRDGVVRNLLRDAAVTGPKEGHVSPQGTVREHLLSLCDQHWWIVDARRV